jgi:hypothetical protein
MITGTCEACQTPYGKHCQGLQPDMKYICGGCRRYMPEQCERLYATCGNFCRGCCGIADRNAKVHRKRDFKELFNNLEKQMYAKTQKN